MNFFKNSKPTPVIETHEVSLAKYSESAILLVLAGVLPQSGIDPQLATVLDLVVGGLRAELQARWMRRGQSLSIQLPSRLPALTIAASAQVFIAMQENLSPQVSVAQAAGPILAPTLEQISGALEIATDVLRSLEECRVEIGKMPAAGEA